MYYQEEFDAPMVLAQLYQRGMYLPYLTYCQRNRLIILLEWTKKEFRFFTGKGHVQNGNNSPSPGVTPKHCHLPDPPHFSLLSPVPLCQLSRKN
jgi:hypothetical protein